MKFRLFKTNQFKRSYKKLRLSDNQEQAFIDVVYKLLNDIKLDTHYHDHFLSGKYESFKECHIKPDLLLIYQIEDTILKLVDIGSHSMLFN